MSNKSGKPSFISKPLFYNPCSKPPIKYYVPSQYEAYPGSVGQLSEELKKKQLELGKVFLSIGID